jgi:hypothetical protein
MPLGTSTSNGFMVFWHTIKLLDGEFIFHLTDCIL